MISLEQSAALLITLSKSVWVLYYFNEICDEFVRILEKRLSDYLSTILVNWLFNRTTAYISLENFHFPCPSLFGGLDYTALVIQAVIVKNALERAKTVSKDASSVHGILLELILLEVHITMYLWLPVFLSGTISFQWIRSLLTWQKTLKKSYSDSCNQISCRIRVFIDTFLFQSMIVWRKL